MSIYVGNKKAKLYRGDYCPAQFYKGDVKIAGYTDVEKVGTSISGVETYNDALNLTIEGKSEQTVTVLGKNLLNCSRRIDRPDTPSTWNPDTGTLLVNGKWFTAVLITLEPDTDYYFSAIRKGATASGGGAVSIFIATGISASDQIISLGARDASFHTKPVVTEYQILLYAAYGAQGECTFRNLSVSKGTQPIPYEPFVPNSPSPDYPSPIRSSENFDVISCGRDPAIATTAHITDPLRSVGDVHDTIEVLDGKVELVKRVERFVNSASAKWEYSATYSGDGFNCWISRIYKALVLDQRLPTICSILKYVYQGPNLAQESVWGQEAPGNTDALLWIKLDATKFPDTASLLAKEFYIDYVPNLPPIRTDITATPLGQALLALRTYPYYTNVTTNAKVSPTVRAKIKEQIL